MPNRQILRLRVLGLVFCLAGGAVITVGWMGMARVACVDCQLPYLLSGGAGGLALIVFGVGLLVIAQIRYEAGAVAAHIEDLAGGQPDPAARGGVLAGESNYHDPGCGLVRDKEHLVVVSVERARANGLTPCRVCLAADNELTESLGTTESQPPG